VKILFITASRIGDALLTTGLLEHLRQQHPGARFTIACGPAAVGVFARMPGRPRIIALPKRRWGLHWLNLWRRTAPGWWDLVVDLRGSAIAWTLPARRRAVKRGGRRPGHRLLHLAAVLGVTPAPRPVAWFDAEDAALAARRVPPGAPFIALCPSATWEPKTWPAERFIALAQALTAADGPLPGARLVVLGGPGPMEARLAAPLLAGLPDAVDLVSEPLDIPTTAALLSRAALYVGNDSGLMHLAAAAGAPTLGLFGPSPAAEYAPTGPRARAVVAPGPPGLAPMRGLRVEAVLAAARDLLAQPLEAATP
jgi:heptosyltransferase III